VIAQNWIFAKTPPPAKSSQKKKKNHCIFSMSEAGGTIRYMATGTYYETHKEQAKTYYQTNKTKIKERTRQWQRDNHFRFVALSIKHRSLRAKALGSATAEQVAARVAYYGWRCAYCRGEYDSIDHVKALSSGGSSHPANLRPCCVSCNHYKGKRDWKEWLKNPHKAWQYDPYKRPVAFL
jgi:5-methylcytosine-specific restriction endonuclease McrA